MMKKRIFALILAGLLTASLASCITRSDENNGTGTEHRIIWTDNEGNPTSFDVVDDTVLTTDSVKLRVNIDSTAGAKQTAALTKLHRTGISTSWSRVEYEGGTYFVSNSYITTDDLLGEGFNTCAPTVMFAKETVNIRKYASSTAAISTVIGTLKVNDTVTVVATNESWSKIEYKNEDQTTSYYFVFSKYLSDTKVEESAGENYDEYFTDCTPKTMYVCTSHANLRVAPSTDEKTGLIKMTLNMDDAVTVVKVGKNESAFNSWSFVKVPDKVKEGDPQTYSYYYISNSCLAATKSTEVQTLDKMLEAYPEFSKLSSQMTLYVLASANLNARKTPVFEGTDNIGANLTSKEKITAVASGTVGSTFCYLIEYKPGVFYFVSAKYLTVNADGEASPLSLEQILQQYPAFKTCTEQSAWATGKVNCYTTPTTSEKVPKTLSTGDEVKVVAKGEGLTYDSWWVIKSGDTCYFAGATLFTTVKPVG